MRAGVSERCVAGMDGPPHVAAVSLRADQVPLACAAAVAGGAPHPAAHGEVVAGVDPRVPADLTAAEVAGSG